MKNRKEEIKASTTKPKTDPPPKDNLKNVSEPKGKEQREGNPKKSD